MINQLKSEIRKLLSVRSTYYTVGLIILITALMSFWFEGYKKSSPDADVFHHALMNVPNLVAFFIAMTAILLATHEYRYNTIVYTLTTSKSRTKTLLSKILAIVLFASAVTVLVQLLSFALMSLGNSMAGHPLPAQDINYIEFFAKALFFVNGFVLAGLLLGILVRNQIATFAILFVLPNVLESLMNLILKENSIYLPFSALGEVVNPPPAAMGDTGPFKFGDLSPGKAAAVYSIYLAIGSLVTWYLFLKRDAN
jgi:ABC-type transport system involved in multi-copper enzyme maturation permease subunit